MPQKIYWGYFHTEFLNQYTLANQNVYTKNTVPVSYTGKRTFLFLNIWDTNCFTVDRRLVLQVDKWWNIFSIYCIKYLSNADKSLHGSLLVCLNTTICANKVWLLYLLFFFLFPLSNTSCLGGLINPTGYYWLLTHIFFPFFLYAFWLAYFHCISL